MFRLIAAIATGDQGTVNDDITNILMPLIFPTSLEIYGIARTPPVSAVPTETPIYGYLKVPKIPSIKSELVAAWPLWSVSLSGLLLGWKSRIFPGLGTALKNREV